MKTSGILRKAIKRRQAALSEYESKKLLAEYGLPVTREYLAGSATEAGEMAERLGFPVVLKACSPELLHKSEGDWVKLDLHRAEEVAQAYSRVTGRPDFSGHILIQEMVSGNRELILGLLRDPQFGPCVMLGLGGIMTEVFNDTVFRMAPINRSEAKAMVSELKSNPILGAFRGQKTVDLESVYDCLVAIGQIGMEREQISEIDVNPMIVDTNGRVKIVDALVVLERNK